VVLYCLGKFPNFNEKLCVGIVGTRKMSRYGRAAAYKFAYELSSLGACVVSGLALGVDATAACGALEGGEPTAQILGCGVGVIYPKAHSHLREEVIKHGALISEYPPLELPQKYYFPQRNRIISGLSQGVFVTECRKESGAMITAKLALAQGKQLFAFPGNVGEPTAEGPNELLRQGAYAAISVEDIVSHYGFYVGLSESEIAEKLKSARENAIDVLDALKKYSIPDRCEENERINSAPLVGARYDPKAYKKTAPKVEQLKIEELKADDIAEAREVTSAPTSTAMDYGLDEKTAKVFEAIPCNTPVSVDKIVCEGLTVQEIVTALTMLEIWGYISSLPGGLYARK
ncbi:MAG: DNA-processing protein DprA, partial [Clostridia bacterium]|nr:DNA-processing protein DprA [Clostridia bacterium]